MEIKSDKILARLAPHTYRAWTVGNGGDAAQRFYVTADFVNELGNLFIEQQNTIERLQDDIQKIETAAGMATDFDEFAARVCRCPRYTFDEPQGDDNA